MAIIRIEITHHQLPLNPPFPASWDPQPRTKFPVTLIRVFDDSGHVGIGSGDAMYGFADYQRYFIGQDPLDLERHHAVLSNIDFHAGRPWPMDVALWDLAGKIRGEPVWKMVGGSSNRIRAYASSGVHRPVGEMVKLAKQVLERGFPAFKVRFGRESLAEDLAVVAAIRDAVGSDLEIMVDCNQGWRMPWDTQSPWNLEKALYVAEKLQDERVYWMEEPLHRGDYTGYSELRRRVSIRIAGGEMTREPYEFRELLERDCLDVFQPDAVCTLGISGLRSLAYAVHAAGKIFTPHTWGNGIGLMANLHLTAGTVGAPFIEFPYDPPEWSLERRDYPLQHVIDVDEAGWITLGEAPGLGLELNEELLAATVSKQATFA
ncbi:mandelate racemase/muconate lactonizing enzyme family protein [Meiothermus sp. Pnk-1]|uniref:mandelate racemase/muconate lactonizing enzyme family protein n=1 Tax=Meiothermus sp. Pnk-1 TaxID=873128 RepID=UPI000D7BD367|nr:mandelate racemase/muconate lactonizing enzyme family protein [Meiothermus sp. Pnk-1]PZA07489.1 mandelate racemase/muconate lactonizing enzyme family protein [Meiothermus sp. Pnk-1]